MARSGGHEELRQSVSRSERPPSTSTRPAGPAPIPSHQPPRQPVHTDTSATLRNGRGTTDFNKQPGQAVLRRRIRALRSKAAARNRNAPAHSSVKQSGIDSLPDEIIAKILKMAQLAWAEVAYPIRKANMSRQPLVQKYKAMLIAQGESHPTGRGI